MNQDHERIINMFHYYVEVFSASGHSETTKETRLHYTNEHRSVAFIDGHTRSRIKCSSTKTANLIEHKLSSHQELSQAMQAQVNTMANTPRKECT